MGNNKKYDGITVVDRFNNNYVKDHITGCWNWTSTLNYSGYAVTSNKGKQIRSHRLSYEIYIGDIPKGLLVCHKCDNRKCVSPFHLFLGTNLDNTRDCIQKGRKRYGKSRKGIFTVPHPSVAFYNRGCRCEDCKKINSERCLARYYRKKNSTK